LLSNTLLVLTSDHGEEFFEHGGLKHGNTLYNEQINIPVIMRYPKIIPEGEVLGDALVQAIDIAPTILDLSGIAKPEAMQGQSLLPLIQKKDIFWRDYAISEAPFVDAKTIITKKWKYIHHFESNLINADLCDKYKKGQELYNRQEDPEELHNLFTDKPEVAQKLYTRLLSLMPDFEAQRIKAKKNLELTRQTKERLKSIGYLQ
jgi:arylsulfatase A-like enzyme